VTASSPWTKDDRPRNAGKQGKHALRHPENIVCPGETGINLWLPTLVGTAWALAGPEQGRSTGAGDLQSCAEQGRERATNGIFGRSRSALDERANPSEVDTQGYICAHFSVRLAASRCRLSLRRKILYPQRRNAPR
jgi:hypothetical protein